MTQSYFKTILTAYVRQGKAEEMCAYLASLRNASFRTASLCLGEASLWQGSDSFWHFAAVLVSANNRAYLGTMLKAAVALHNVTPTPEFAQACTTDIDRKKVLEALLPLVTSPTDMQQLIRLFRIESDAIIEGILYRVGTATAYFLLFNLLKQHEDETDYLRRFGVELIRKGDKRSFNLACVIKEYFALPSLPGTFSLSLKPYELSRLETSYETFLTIINK